MLKIIRDWKLVDFLRSFQGNRAYGIPVSKNYMALQWYGAYSDTERSIVYFIARQIDGGDVVKVNYDIGPTYIKYENGQYLYDNTMLFDGILPDGVFFFEFNDGFETYRSQCFAVKDIPELLLASGYIPASSSDIVSSINVENPNKIYLKQFEVENTYVQFEYH